MKLIQPYICLSVKTQKKTFIQSQTMKGGRMLQNHTLLVDLLPHSPEKVESDK